MKQKREAMPPVSKSMMELARYARKATHANTKRDNPGRGFISEPPKAMRNEIFFLFSVSFCFVFFFFFPIIIKLSPNGDTGERHAVKLPFTFRRFLSPPRSSKCGIKICPFGYKSAIGDVLCLTEMYFVSRIWFSTFGTHWNLLRAWRWIGARIRTVARVRDSVTNVTSPVCMRTRVHTRVCVSASHACAWNGARLISYEENSKSTDNSSVVDAIFVYAISVRRAIGRVDVF